MSETIRNVLQTLEEKNIPYELAEHIAVYTIEEMLAAGLPNQDAVAKNLFIRDDKKRNYYLFSIRDHKKLNLKQMRQQLGTRPLTFASERDLNEILDLEKGAVTPFGVLNDVECKVQVFIDETFKGKQIAVHPNENTATVWLQTEDLAAIIEAHGNPVTFITVPEEKEWQEF